MNPSTAVYLHDLFAENGLIRITLREPFLVAYGDDTLGVKVNRYSQIVMAEYRDEEDDWEYAEFGSGYVRPEDQIDISSL